MAASLNSLEKRVALLEKLARANGWSFPGDKPRSKATADDDAAE